MRSISIIFQTKMFLVILALLILYTFIFAPIGFNQTIMWGWFDKFNFYIKFYFQFILIFYSVCYGILTLTKKRTNKYISIIHTIIIFTSMLLLKPQTEDIFGLLSILSLVSFLINVTISLKKSKFSIN